MDSNIKFAAICIAYIVIDLLITYGFWQFSIIAAPAVDFWKWPTVVLIAYFVGIPMGFTTAILSALLKLLSEII
jgi:hypothetical protein